MIKQMQANRMKMEQSLFDSEKRKYISPFYYWQYELTLPLILKYARGKFIDLGCGDMPYRAKIEPHVEVYHGLDFTPRSDLVNYAVDIQNMPEVESDSYESAICLEVLEHIPNPFAAAHEIYRIMKSEGVLILTVPHLSRLHDLPHDYYRYTRFGLEYLLKNAGFKILSIQERGGLFSFLGHQISLALVSAFWGIPVIRNVVFVLNSLFVTRLCFWLDKLLKLDRFFPLGYTVVAQK